jgi:hypothetical protein
MADICQAKIDMKDLFFIFIGFIYPSRQVLGRIGL